jgi:dihydropteroate synthase
MFETVASLRVPYILMHMRGNPKTMNARSDYENPVMEIVNYFHKKIHTLHEHGVSDIIVDPGFGFAKSASQGFQLLDSLSYFGILGKPILAGLSRKSMIWKTLGIDRQGLNGTTCLNTIALVNGANILRVHDVKEAMEVVNLVSLIRKQSSGDIKLIILCNSTSYYTL